MLERSTPQQPTDLTQEELEAIEEEVRILGEVLHSLAEQRKEVGRRFDIERKRARQLTSEIVATRRDEDRAMLASEEAVSHALKDKGFADLKTLEQLLKKPYFARFVVEEEEDGKIVQHDYRLGFSANPECRIIDWRKAPISRLYYEYREGDEFYERIQHRDREGKIILRNAIDISNDRITRIQNRFGTFTFEENTWRKLGASGRSLSRAGRASGDQQGYLPEISSLITADQFQTITEEANTAVLIQGIAGSGKTTVALHRLAWLLHKDNSDLTADDCLVVMISNVLKAYTSQLLPSLGVEGVRIDTFREWIAKIVGRLSPELVDKNEKQLRRPTTAVPAALLRLKSTLAFLSAVEDVTLELESPAGNLLELFHQVYNLIFSEPERILQRDETKLLDQEVIALARTRFEVNGTTGVIDVSDYPFLLRIAQLRGGTFNGSICPRYGHVVVDEVQDLSPAELAALIGSVEKTRHLTLVGDTAQEVQNDGSFPGWEKLKQHWSFEDDSSTYVALTVSHRSSLPIMRLAEHVIRKQRVTSGRKGRVPIWFKCNSENKGIQSAITWLQTALERYPHDMTAVICRDSQQAKFAHSLLEPSFGAAVRLGDEHSFRFDAGIVVTDVLHAKGLEFVNVLLWNPNAKDFPASRLGGNLLYVAMTRAEENLCLVTWNRPSALLPSVYSKLVRGIDMSVEEL